MITEKQGEIQIKRKMKGLISAAHLNRGIYF
jgi:hypothetical protein